MVACRSVRSLLPLGLLVTSVAAGCDDEDLTRKTGFIHMAHSASPAPRGLAPDAALGLDAAADAALDTAAPVEDVHEPEPDAATSDLGPLEDGEPHGGDEGPPPDEQPGPGPVGPGTPEGINLGFIGGACESEAACDFAGGFCLEEAAGFPAGHCTLPCDKFCPDAEGAVTTFCVDPLDLGETGDEGLCVARCDFGASDTGCRPGYQCVALPRHGDPATIIHACIPGDDQAFALSPCHQELLDRGVSFTPGINKKSSPSGHPNLVCDVNDPVWVQPVIHGVSFRYAKTTATPAAIYASCPLALSLEHTAALLQEQGYTDVIHLGVYNCRVISGSSKLSEHAYANAIDISGLVDADGTHVTVLGDWEKGVLVPLPQGGSFLKWFVEALFDEAVFNIILTPEYNAAHADHFHCDLTPGAHYMK